MCHQSKTHNDVKCSNVTRCSRTRILSFVIGFRNYVIVRNKRKSWTKYMSLSYYVWKTWWKGGNVSDPVRLDYEWVVTGDSASTPIFSKSSQCFLALFLTDFQPLFSLNDPDGFFKAIQFGCWCLNLHVNQSKFLIKQCQLPEAWFLIMNGHM